MSKHTPGPWERSANNISSVGIRGANGFAVCACRFKGPDGRTVSESVAEGRANARLIAASPDMLAALQTAERLLLDGVGREKVRAAIAKATGDA